MKNGFAVMGSAFYSESFDEIKYIKNGLFCVDSAGIIERVATEQDEDYLRLKNRYSAAGALTVLDEKEIILPGFVDLHIHASQWPQAGTALDRPLEEWLGEYTFPLEAKYRDMSFARKVYGDIVKTTLESGTTTAMYFATVDRRPSVLLAKICARAGQRALVGKVVMDDKASNPDFCRDPSPERAVAETEKFIREVEEIQHTCKQKVYPVITPRFIPSCTDECLEMLGQLAKEKKIHIQTHCSESDWAHGYAKERYGINDAAALDKFGFITDKTVLAHAPFLEEDDVRLLAEKGTSIAHSPLSNAYFAGAVLPLKKFYEKGINIGLATDISGGYCPDMYSAVRQAVISSRMLNDGVNPDLARDKRGVAGSAITLNNAFFCATVGGGKALGLPVGRLERGQCFDIQVVDTSRGFPLYYPEKKPEDLLHKILLLTTADRVCRVWVQGQRVK